MTKHKHGKGPAREPKKQPIFESPMTPTTPQEAKMGEQGDSGASDEKKVTKELAREFRWVEGTQIASNVILVVVGVVALCIYNGQLEQMRTSNKNAKDAVDIANATLKISQRAFVTIGRKDGVVADFVIPKDPKQNAEIVIYFQNSGHIPAKFVWGTQAPFLAEGSKKNSTGITWTHPFKGFLNRTRDKKTGSIGEQGGSSVIPGDSVFIDTLGVISQKDLAALPTNNMGLLIAGEYGYCDELGNSVNRMFGLTYRSNAPTSSLSFGLANETDWPSLRLPKSTDTTEYLFPCKTLDEK